MDSTIGTNVTAEAMRSASGKRVYLLRKFAHLLRGHARARNKEQGDTLQCPRKLVADVKDLTACSSSWTCGRDKDCLTMLLATDAIWFVALRAARRSRDSQETVPSEANASR